MEAYHPLTGPLAVAWRARGARHLGLGSSGALCRARLGDLLVAIQHTLPEAEIGVREMSRDTALSALGLGQIDAAILPGDADPRFRSAALWQERIALHLPAGPGRDRAGMTLDDLAATPLFVSAVPEERAFHDFAIKWLFDQNQRLRPPCRAQESGAWTGMAHAMLVPLRDPSGCADVTIVTIDDPRAAIEVVAHWLDG